MENKEKTDIFDQIWNFFTSVQLAVITLIILAATSIIGTIVEQRAESATNIALLAKFFGDSTAPTVYNIFVKFGFMDMYRSWWFVGLLILFGINLIICSIDRFPKTLRLVNSPLRPLKGNAIRNLPVKKELRVKAGIRNVKDEVLNSLTESSFRVLEASEENSFQLYSQKGRYTRFGVYIIHASIIIILVGAIIGARFGFGGFLNLREGKTASFAMLSSGPLTETEEFERGRILDVIEMSRGDMAVVSNVLGIDGNTLNAKMKRLGIKPLGFTIKCNWYETLYYSGTDTPQEFQSEIVIIDGGREVMKKVIEVNHPITYKGITFYQASYGMFPGAEGKLVIEVTPKGGNTKELRLDFGDSFEIEGTGIKGTVVDFSPALTRDRMSGALTTYSESMVNPAIAIEFNMPDNEKFTGWILKRYPETGILSDGSEVKFLDYWGIEYTGLQVSKDPGVWLIYFASITMTIGLFACFFMSHRKIWISIAPDASGAKNSVIISAGGTASKNRLSLEKDLESILSKASQKIQERQSKSK